MSPHCAKANWLEFQWEFNQCQDIVIQRLVKMTAGGSRVWRRSSATCKITFLNFFCNFFLKKTFDSVSVSYNCTSNPRTNNWDFFVCFFKIWWHFPMIVNNWRFRVNLCLCFARFLDIFTHEELFVHWSVHNAFKMHTRAVSSHHYLHVKKKKEKSAFL